MFRGSPRVCRRDVHTVCTKVGGADPNERRLDGFDASPKVAETRAHQIAARQRGKVVVCHHLIIATEGMARGPSAPPVTFPDLSDIPSR